MTKIITSKYEFNDPEICELWLAQMGLAQRIIDAHRKCHTPIHYAGSRIDQVNSGTTSLVQTDTQICSSTAHNNHIKHWIMGIPRKLRALMI